ncbi:DUF3592 domain-containing protein [Glaciecola sp. MH2013]|uniref:DUF3592 domain-containing protein n=1 Tax=Glaciecola sp. MH2013 TaxID=2785524 RepID=UPI00189DA097|nr:DUF3592 domain-containing protein [Glaciecola sp. MH2013]MBF7073426.1 DUF3592 domain-containing protein [Glaciecola sp. MH2013]
MMKTIAPALILIVACILLVYAAIQFFKQREFLANASTAEGTFIGYEYTSSTDFDALKDVKMASSTFPKFEFTTITGELIQFESSTSVHNPSQGVTVIYSADNPKNAQVLSFFSTYGWIAALAGLGGILLIVAGVLRLML